MNDSLSYLAFVFRLYPTPAQASWLTYVFKANKRIWNDLLRQEIERKENQEDRTPVSLLMAQAFAYIKREGFEKGDPRGYACVAKLLSNAINRHERKPDINGYPRFRSVDSLPYSYIVQRNGKYPSYDGEFLYLSHIGKVKIRGLRPLPFGAEILAVYIKQRRDGKYYASISFAMKSSPPKLPEFIAEKSIGLDFSPNRLFVSSDPDVQMQKNILVAQSRDTRRLQRRSRDLSRSKKASKNFERKRLSLAVLEAHIAARRKDIIEKATDFLTKHYGIICIEDLDLKELSSRLRPTPVGKAIHNSSWSIFVERLSQKCKQRGNRLVKVGPRFPSTKQCSVCGHIKEMPLAERVYDCPKCGNHMDRDVNAAINIQREGLRLLKEKKP